MLLPTGACSGSSSCVPPQGGGGKGASAPVSGVQKGKRAKRAYALSGDIRRVRPFLFADALRPRRSAKEEVAARIGKWRSPPRATRAAQKPAVQDPEARALMPASVLPGTGVSAAGERFRRARAKRSSSSLFFFYQPPVRSIPSTKRPVRRCGASG